MELNQLLRPELFRVRVEHFEPRDQNSLRGILTLVIDFANGVALRMKRATYHEQGGGSDKRWVAFPAQSYGSSYAHILELTDDEAKAHFRRAAVAAVDKYRSEEMAR